MFSLLINDLFHECKTIFIIIEESEFPKNENIIQLDTPQSDNIKTSNVYDETEEKSTVFYFQMF